MNLFGRVAGRVGGVAGRVGGAVFGEARAALTAQQTDESEVETLLQNIQDGMMPEFRREAMTALKGLLTDNHKAQLALGHMGLPILINVLCDDRDDLELVRGALESLVLAMSNQEEIQHGEAPPGAINSELFARRPEHVSLLLALLEDEPVGINDFYVRYYTVQLLTALLQACPYKLQEAILASPMGVVRLMDMLMEREVIRNEALQLLVVLTRQNEEVQKIAAFEGAFERIFNMIREEGAAGGGVVVQDCLELMNNLLRKNDANQRLFREMGYATHLTQLLVSGAPEAPPSEKGAPPQEPPSKMGIGLASWSTTDVQRHFAGGPATVTPLPRQKAAILLAAIEGALLLVAPPSSACAEQQAVERASRTTNQTKLLQVGLFDALLPLCLTDGGLPSISVRRQAYDCLGDLVAELPAGQEKLGCSSVHTRVGELPVLLAALRIALYADEGRERKAAENLIASYCRHNPGGQSQLASTFAPLPARANKPGSIGQGLDRYGTAHAPPPGMDSSDILFGTELLMALTLASAHNSSALQISCRAVSVLQYLLADNSNAKQHILSTPVELPASPHSPPDMLMPRIMRLLSDSLRMLGDQGKLSAALLMRTLLVALKDHPPAVAALLEGAPHLPMLVDMVNGRLGGGDGVVSGLAALIMGVCLVYGKPSHLPPTLGAKPSLNNPAETVMSVLLARVGLTQFFHRLEDLRKSPMFVAASNAPKLPKPITRANAAVATAGDAGVANEVEDRAKPVDEQGTKPSEVSPFDLQFTLFVEEVEVGVHEKAMEAFAQPARRNSQGGSSGGCETSSPVLPGTSDTEKLHHTLNLIQRLEAEMAELRNRNRSLVEDSFRKEGAAPPSATEFTAEGTGRPPYPPQRGLGGPPSSAADVEARVAAELRASRAEREAVSMKQQVEQLQSRLATAEHIAHEAQAHAAHASSAAAKHESDLKELSGAYNTIESHSFHLEAQLRELQGKLNVSQQSALAAQQSLHTVQAQLHEAQSAKLTADERDAALGAPGGGGVSEVEVQRRVEEAVAKAKAEAEEEGEEQLTDLLVCLGQEETKVAALSKKLQTFGVDVDEIIDAIVAAAEEEEGSDVL